MELKRLLTITLASICFTIILFIAPSQTFADGIIAGCPMANGGDFEEGVIPPAHWTHIQSNTNQTWQLNSNDPYQGAYAADCNWDISLNDQDEWLVTPYFTNPQEVNFWSQGSVTWCRDTFDNCDLQVWLIKGPGVNDGDDVYLGKADDDWLPAAGYARSQFQLPISPGTRPRIGFRYVGNNGWRVSFDSVRVCTRDDLRVDFGGSGLWHYDISGSWKKLSPNDAQWLASYSDRLVVDFGSLGLWEYTGAAWKRITPGDADNSGNTMVAYKNGLVIDFGTNGLWYYDKNGNWRKLSPSNAQWLGLYSDKLVADFGSNGMYQYDGVTWVKITPADADNSGNTMIGGTGAMVVDFGASGLYCYDGSNWTKLSPSNAQWLGIRGSRLVVDFGAYGLYEYTGAAWIKITTGNADNSGNTMVERDTFLVVDFGANGLYDYDGTSWRRISTANAQWLKTVYHKLIVDFGTSGMYEYDGSNWVKITTADADNSGNTMMGW